MENVLIIGAGLSGLSTAYQLKKAGISVKVLEAQNRLGGRIETIKGKHETPMEMGATWFGKEHTNLLRFLSEINIGYFEQHTEGIGLFETLSFEPPQQYFVPANAHSAYRVQGGTSNIIEALYQYIGAENIVLNTTITEIIDEGECISVTDGLQNRFTCKHLIMAMPPQLIINAIQFYPPLPENLAQIMQKTQTWMSGSVKFSVEYPKAFWKERGFSGSIFSQSGLATEIYDHSNFENTKFALKGFLNSSAYNYSEAERAEKVIAQLTKYFGKEAQEFISYNDKIWNDTYIKPQNEVFLPPHHNNGNALFRDRYMNNKVFFTGTETSKAFGGYMEGAIIASDLVVAEVLQALAKK